MKRRTVAALALVVVLAVPRPGAADPITDFINSVILAKINNVLSAMILWEQRLLDRAQIDIYNRYRFFAFPEGIFQAIYASIAEVRAIRGEVAALSCGWRFSPRTGILRDLYARNLRLCKPSFQFIWGSHTAGPDRDLHEMNDYVAVLTANQISQQTQSEETMARVFSETYRKALVPGFSPGESNRHEAAMLAMAGQVALSNNQLANQKLLVDQMERDLDRRELQHAAVWSTFGMESLATLDRSSRSGGERP